MAKKRIVKKNSPDPLIGIFHSEGFNLLIQRLELDHPVHIAIGVSASLEQRAMRQCEIQAYEAILQRFRKWSTEAKASSIEATYEPQQG